MKIVTDSAVDLPEEMFAQYGIERMPLLITFGTESLRSGIDIQPEEFYRRLAASRDQSADDLAAVGGRFCRICIGAWAKPIKTSCRFTFRRA